MKTNVVRMAVARFEGMPSMPNLARIDVGTASATPASA